MSITINSKWKVGDTVWVMSENRPVKTTIEDISLVPQEGMRGIPERLKWVLAHKELASWSNLYKVRIERREGEMYETKQELLASL